jgi:hypothetical protein
MRIPRLGAADLAGPRRRVRQASADRAQYGSHLDSAVVARVEGNPFIFWQPQVRHHSAFHLIWHGARRQAGLADVRLHDLRHSFASFRVNNGTSLYVVKDLLGHSDARTAQRYAHLADATLIHAVENITGSVLASRAGLPSSSTHYLHCILVMSVVAVPTLSCCTGKASQTAGNGVPCPMSS